MREDVDSLIPRDIYNFRQKKHFEFLDGRTPIQALLTSLPDEGNWIFNYEKTADGVVTALFCTPNNDKEAVAEFRRQVDKKWKEMLGLWWKVVDAIRHGPGC